MSWINLPGFRGGPSAATHGHGANNQRPQENNAERRDIMRNFVKAAELKKLNTKKKKWFVLYEDSRHSLTNPRRSVFDEDADEPNGQHSDDDEDIVPAFLEYHNSERNWKAGEPPKRVIILKNAFSITRKKDTKDSIHKYVIAIYTVEDCLGIVFETEQDMLLWQEMLISCQMGGRSAEGRMPRPTYKHIWEVEVEGFTSDNRSHNSFHMSGPYRLCVTSKEVKFFALGSSDPKVFQISSLRGCAIDKRNTKVLKLRIGKNSISGGGDLIYECKDGEISENIKDVILQAMDELKITHRRHRDGTRPRSESWSNVDKSISGGSRSGHHGGSKSSRSRQAYQIATGGAVATPQAPTTAQAVQDALRTRTTSEGNHFDVGKTRWAKAILPSSPISPGSIGVSSESAGSSNSIDDNGGGSNTPVGTGDHTLTNTPSTIYEELSAESCIEQPYVSSKPSQTNPSEPLPTTTTEATIHYTSVDIIPNAMRPSLPLLHPATTSSPPGGAGVHYSTIVNPCEDDPTQAPPMQSSGDYMVMTPPSAALVASAMGGPNNSLTRRCVAVPSNEQARTQRNSLLGLMEDSVPAAGSNENSSCVASPTSQSSYNPLDDVNNDTDSSSAAYVIASPTSSSGGGTLPGSRVGTGPRPASKAGSNHKRTSSNTASLPPSSTRSAPISTSSTAASNDEYVDMSPSVGILKGPGVPIPSRNDHARNTSSAVLGSSPSAALTSHLAGPLPHFHDTPSATKTPPPPAPSDDNLYLVMSPVDPDKHKLEDFRMSAANKTTTPPLKLRASSIDASSGGARPKTTRPGSHQARTGGDRNSLCLDDYPPRQWAGSVTAEWNKPPVSQGATLMNDVEGANDPDRDYVPVDFNNVRPPPLSSTHSRGHTSRRYETSHPVYRLRPRGDEESHDEEKLLDSVATGEEDDSLPPVPRQLPGVNSRAYSVGCRPFKNGGGGPLGGSNSSVSTTGSSGLGAASSRYIDIPGAGSSGAGSTGGRSHTSSISPGAALLGGAAALGNATTTGQSPSTMASRIGSWFRHRAGSVPTRPAVVRRRHRTQSEGEKEEGGPP